MKICGVATSGYFSVITFVYNTIIDTLVINENNVI